MPDDKTVHLADDGTNMVFVKDVADMVGDLTASTFYGAKMTQLGDKGASAVETGFDVEWIELASGYNAEIEGWIAEDDDITQDDYTADATSCISGEDIAAWAAGDAADDRVAPFSLAGDDHETPRPCCPDDVAAGGHSSGSLDPDRDRVDGASPRVRCARRCEPTLQPGGADPAARLHPDRGAASSLLCLPPVQHRQDPDQLRAGLRPAVGVCLLRGWVDSDKHANLGSASRPRRSRGGFPISSIARTRQKLSTGTGWRVMALGGAHSTTSRSPRPSGPPRAPPMTC